MNPQDRERLNTVISEVVNSIQTAAPLATQLRRELSDRAQTALTLEAALDRAAKALRGLREDESR